MYRTIDIPTFREDARPSLRNSVPWSLQPATFPPSGARPSSLVRIRSLALTPFR